MRMKRLNHIHDILFWMAGALLLLTLLSMRFVGGVYSKYALADSAPASARVAVGLPEIELKEHEAELVDGKYVLNDTEVTGNTYERVIPGVDIEKDPFVRLSGGSEVSYALYISVTESEPFPERVSYELREDWEEVSGQDGVYRYTGTMSGDPIYILKNNRLTVSQDYVDGGAFTLSFSAWMEQLD